MAKPILIVDDDPDLREATGMILTGAGYQVAQAGSGQEALEMLQSRAFSLVILDVMMETDTEGFHLAYKIRQDPKLKGLPIIMLTSIEERTGEPIDLGEAGDFLPVDMFLRKPVSAEVLKAKVAQLVVAGA